MFKSRNQNPPTYASLFAKLGKIENKNVNSIELEQQQPKLNSNELISYDSFMKMRMNLAQEQSNTPSNPHDILPIKYIIIHLIILTFLSLILIGLQIAVIYRSQPYAFIGSGIWMGAYNLIMVFLSITASM